ncbi:MAG: T9SS type A sorting domain-containing protein, partial [Winogradskyella arenosi]
TINVSNNTALRYLDVSGNSLSSIDVSAIVGLRQFDVSDNPMSSLDVSSNTALISLYCYNDNLTSLDLSNNTALIELSCGNNALTTLDVTANSTLYDIYCQDNALTSLKVANGVNSPYGRLNALNNPDLTCIEVDDVAWSTANWTSIDATASFSADCSALSVDDFTFNVEVSLYPNPTTSVLNIKMDSNLKRATIYSTLGAIVLETTSKTIATANLKSGFYLIRIEDENGNIATNRFIKE